MGVKELRDAWNAVSGDYQATRVLVTLPRDAAGNETQVMTFYGFSPDGQAFEAVTDPHHPGSNAVAVAQELAQNFVSSLKADASKKETK